jgi:hypothetical protein
MVYNAPKYLILLRVLSTSKLEWRELYGLDPAESMDWEDDIPPIGFHKKM